MAEELAKAASSDQMLRNLKLTGVSTLHDSCVGIYQRRKRLQQALVNQFLFYTQFVAKVTQALTPKTEVRLAGACAVLCCAVLCCAVLCCAVHCVAHTHRRHFLVAPAPSLYDRVHWVRTCRAGVCRHSS